jgi:hypothetical protein
MLTARCSQSRKVSPSALGKTPVIYCFDPRAADIPEAVAAYLGDEVTSAKNILDAAGLVQQI